MIVVIQCAAANALLRPAADLLTSWPIQKSRLAIMIGCTPGPMIFVRMDFRGDNFCLSTTTIPVTILVTSIPPINSIRTKLTQGFFDRFESRNVYILG